MDAKLCALLLVASCTGGVGNDTAVDPGTAEDAATPGDASVDARRPDAARDARVIDARGEQDRDTGSTQDEDASSEEDVVDAAVVDSATPPVDAGNPPLGNGTKPVFIAVGYKGSRLISRDLGVTWTETATLMGEGDDKNLLRGAAFGNGVFVAAGWNVFSSPDGATWTQRTMPISEWIGGLDFGAPSGKTSGIFVGAGGGGNAIYSSDGVSWSAGKPNGTHTRSCAYGDGKFMGATDKVDWFATSDGNTWTKDSGGHGSNKVVWCKDRFSDRASCSEPIANGNAAAFGMGVYVSTDGNKIRRSTDNGKTWSEVKTINNSAWIEDIAFGLVP
ncbi:MAG TPA: hypothetical protein VFX59_14840 [Polyangiales bacterium]|nr:hypothetical protein [Polyangiales bacterium]